MGRFAFVKGHYLDSKGYWCFCAGLHRGKRVHRVLMERYLGRTLRRDEHVHHRDENKQNNGLHADGAWNLEVKGEREHNAVSSRQYWYLKKFVWPREQAEWESINGPVQ